MIIVIRGPAGVGKTVVSKKLAKKLKCECIHIDDVLKKHDLDCIKGECIPEENFLKVNNLIDLKGKYIVVEGNFYHKSVIMDLINKGKCIIFSLEAPLKECIKRDSNRKGIGARSVKDVFNLSFPFGTNIDTFGKTEEEVVNEIIKKIKV
jgi:cytidylate kinase